MKFYVVESESPPAGCTEDDELVIWGTIAGIADQWGDLVCNGSDDLIQVWDVLSPEQKEAVLLIAGNVPIDFWEQFSDILSDILGESA